MCGICGIIAPLPKHEILPPLTRATRALTHRGPDDEGLDFLTPDSAPLTAAFGHRRLSILDLSSAGHQPMHEAATGNWITYNGEVFNFQEVRRTLEARGLHFQSNSDTEVLLKSYGLLGQAAIESWRGMFALGFWEAAAQRLVLVRDRLGIKPLYYYYDGQNFLFASEVRALLATGLVPRKLSRVAVESYLAYGSVQQPLTIIENVYAVLPGHLLTFANGQLRTEPYWRLSAPALLAAPQDKAAVTEEIAALLLEAVRLRLVSDVPVGVFLSGGIDSSALVSLLRRATASEVKTFSVFFKELDFNERVYAERVAQAYETDHHSVFLSEREVLTKLPRALNALDQPAVDGLNSFIVSEAAVGAGLKVALSGLGGDEVFAGYDFFRTVEQSERRRTQVQMVPTGLRRAASTAIGALGTLSHNHRANKLSLLLRSEHLHEHSVQLHRRLFTREQQQRLLAANGYASETYQRDWTLLADWTSHQRAGCATADAVNQASIMEMCGYLSNTLLRDTDTMSMAHSLEVRVPLIDHKLVERMLALPGALKMRPHEPKKLLVDAVGNLPPEIVNRPKRGFELPFKHWLLGELREQVEQSFTAPGFDSLFQPQGVQALWQDFLQGRVTWSRVWSVFVLGEWLRRNL
ncbi:MAG: asparagine synthase (glutamine-hydrolyzing) [Acidobacteria bacterium]|nr:asparagine synthase (glutamine-hydrolyzing) [Acidobacteriota bacterium]MBI3428062.1 asparagine synthase (glutamine-hydrolyzing) [Acidobacteriota bacterium]